MDLEVLKTRMQILMSIFVLHTIVTSISAEEICRISIDDVIYRLAMNTPKAKTEKLNFLNTKLQYENYRKSLLPSVSFNLFPISFNHSLKLLQNPSNGNYNYINDYSNTSNLGITINQKIQPTGGTLTVNTSLNYLTEFTNNRGSFNTNPYSIGYSQQLWGGYKASKYNNELQNLKFKQIKKNYCSKISDIQKEALSQFFSLFKTQLEMKLSLNTKNCNDTLLQLAQLKLKNGSFTTYEYNQIEIQTTNSAYAYENAVNNYQSALFDFSSFFGTSNQTTWIIETPTLNTPLFLDSALVKAYVEHNNPFTLNEHIQRLEAESSLHNAKVGSLFNGNLNLNYGTNQYATILSDAYKKSQIRQSVSLVFSIPVFQWGTNRNKLKIAKNMYQVSMIELEKASRDFQKNIADQVNSYNHAVKLWKIAEKSYKLSVEQYQLTLQEFSLGKISLYELFNAQQEQFSSMQKYYKAIFDTWSSYFELRKITLYDFMTGKELTEEWNDINE